MLPTIERRAFISDVDVTNLRLLHFLPGNCSICRVPSQFPPFPFYSTLLPLTRSALVSNVIRAPLRQQEEQLLGSADWGTVCVDSSSEITIFSNRIFRFVKISHLTFFGYLENAGILLLVFLLRYNVVRNLSNTRISRISILNNLEINKIHFCTIQMYFLICLEITNGSSFDTKIENCET